MVTNLHYVAPLGASYHPTLKCSFNCYMEQEKKGKKQYRYNRNDYDELWRIMMQYDWDSILHEKNCTDSWDVFHD